MAVIKPSLCISIRSTSSVLFSCSLMCDLKTITTLKADMKPIEKLKVIRMYKYLLNDL